MGIASSPLQWSMISPKMSCWCPSKSTWEYRFLAIVLVAYLCGIPSISTSYCLVSRNGLWWPWPIGHLSSPLSLFLTVPFLGCHRGQCQSRAQPPDIHHRCCYLLLCCLQFDRILRLTTFNSLLQCVNRLVGRFVLSTEWFRTRKLDYNDLNWPRCSARVTESLALTDGSFCQSKTLYISDYVKLVSL